MGQRFQLPPPGGWDSMCDELVEVAERMRRDGPEVFRRSKIAARDGFPRSTRAEGHGSGGVHDPVFEVVAGGAVDPVATSSRRMISNTMRALHLLRKADAARASAFPKDTPDDGEAGCVAHARAGLYAPVDKRDRCRSCNDHAARHDGEDPTIAEIREGECCRIHLAVGLLERKRAKGLCRWCARFIKSQNREPTTREVRALEDHRIEVERRRSA